MSTFGKKCTACGTERRRKGILYHPDTFEPYCESAYLCNEKHPNSFKNLLKRALEKGIPPEESDKATIQLLPYQEAAQKFEVWAVQNLEDQEKAIKIRRLVTKPLSIRIVGADMAEFLLQLQDDLGTQSLGDTIRYCIDKVMESKTGFYHEQKQMFEEKKEEERFEQNVKKIEKAIEEKPKQEEENNREELVF